MSGFAPGNQRIRQIVSAEAPTPGGPYSHALAAAGFVFVSGQRPEIPGKGVVPGGIGEQTHQVLRNLEAVLAAAHLTLKDVVRVNAYLADISYFDEFNGVYKQYFQAPYPARTTIGAQLRGILVEIDVIAFDPRSDPP